MVEFDLKLLALETCSEFQRRVLLEDATKTNFDNASFDLVMISFAIHEKARNAQQALINEACRIIKKDEFMLVVDYVFDNKTTKFGQILIRLIEKIAGGEHNRNFKNYIKNKGLSSLIKKDKFQLIKCNRRSSGAVTISIYQKILLY